LAQFSVTVSSFTKIRYYHVTEQCGWCWSHKCFSSSIPDTADGITISGCTVLVYNQSVTPTQPPTLSGTGNEYRPRDRSSALRLRR